MEDRRKRVKSKRTKKKPASTATNGNRSNSHETSSQPNQEGWSAARKEAYKQIHTNENAYYFRFNAPNEKPRTGKWREEEKTLFFKIYKDMYGEIDLENEFSAIARNIQWGLFSKRIPGRVGYQCSYFYHSLFSSKKKERGEGDPKDEAEEDDEEEEKEGSEDEEEGSEKESGGEEESQPKRGKGKRKYVKSKTKESDQKNTKSKNKREKKDKQKTKIELKSIKEQKGKEKVTKKKEKSPRKGKKPIAIPTENGPSTDGVNGEAESKVVYIDDTDRLRKSCWIRPQNRGFTLPGLLIVYPFGKD